MKKSTSHEPKLENKLSEKEPPKFIKELPKPAPSKEPIQVDRLRKELAEKNAKMQQKNKPVVTSASPR